jgi:hypothetical protein
MQSDGVASATDPVGIECGGVPTSCVSGGDYAGTVYDGALVGSEYAGATAGCEPGGASAASASDGAPAGSGSGGASAVSANVGSSDVGGVVAAVDGLVPITSCWSGITRPQLGLIGTESVLSGGALRVPTLLDGSESNGLAADQAVLRGGHLKKPQIFTDLEITNHMKFITLDKTDDGLCYYLTGKKAYAYPLKNVVLFDDMQKTMIKHCNHLMTVSKRQLAEAKAKARSAAKQDFDMVLKKTVMPKQAKARSDAKQDRDNHKKRVLNALPPTGVVDMSRGGTDWHPVCLIRTGTKNVSMQYTAENFTKLFEIVSKCLSNPQSGAVTPQRKLRRTPSTGKTPRGLPGERQYWSASKGIWLEKTRREVTTPPSGSGKSISKAHRNRVFKKAQSVMSASRGSGPRPKAKKRASTQGSKRSKLVLAPDAASQSDDDDADDASSSTNFFK